MKYRNPILTGMHPDPSICRVGGDYYLVTSTFEYWPGVPLFHSRDLLNWECIGHALTENVNLEKCHPSRGIFAPTIRYINDTFYIITTNMDHGGNFIVSSKDLKTWSEPLWIGPDGIDPSLLYDQGRTYYVHNNYDAQGRLGIYLAEIDLQTGRLLTEEACISYGCGGTWPEGPHLYHIGKYYYLMLAEGGTEYGHYEAILRAASIWGPYVPDPDNPIIKNRDSMSADVFCCGHADLFEDEEGNWWLVCLGTRKNGPFYNHHLGRETMLAPVIWQNGWPKVGTDGCVYLNMEGPIREGTVQQPIRDFRDTFETPDFPLEWTWLRNPELKNYVRGNHSLLLQGTKVTLNEEESPTWLGVRQKEFVMRAECTMELDVLPQLARAGLGAFYDKDYHYEICAEPSINPGQIRLSLYKHLHDTFVRTSSVELSFIHAVSFRIEADAKWYRFYYKAEQDWVLLGAGMTAGVSTENTYENTYTGVMIGIFAENCAVKVTSFAMTHPK